MSRSISPSFQAGTSLMAAMLTSLMPIAAIAQERASDLCMSLRTDAARIDCLRKALDAAERSQAEAGLAGADPASQSSPRGERQAFVPTRSSTAAGAAGLGIEQVPDRERPDVQGKSRYPAAIVSFREISPGQMRFTLDNGQVWQQTQADAQRLVLGKGPIPVELWESWTGGYRLLLADERRVVRVQRIR